MAKITLDPRKLLGFKILVNDADPRAPIKLGAKTGTKDGVKPPG